MRRNGSKRAIVLLVMVLILPTVVSAQEQEYEADWYDPYGDGCYYWFDGVQWTGEVDCDGDGYVDQAVSSDGQQEFPSEGIEETTAEGAVFVSNTSGGDQNQWVKSYVIAVIAHADRIWKNWFSAAGYSQTPLVAYYIIEAGDTYNRSCRLNIGSNHPNAYYCPTDYLDQQGTRYQGMVIFPLETMTKMWSGRVLTGTSRWPGDFAAAALIGHEMGHHVVDEMMLQKGYSRPVGKNFELLADCLSGAWAVAAYSENLLEPGDIEEAIYAMESIGVYNDAKYGTPEERVRAWQIGFYGRKDNPVRGLPQNCFNTYWTS